MRYRFPYVGAADLRKPSSSQAPANTARPRIRAGVSHDVFTLPAFAGTHSSLTTDSRLRLSRPGCLVLHRGSLPIQRWSPTQALTVPSVE